MKILIATHNTAKLQEIRKGLRELTDKGIEFASLQDLHIRDQPKETGSTFQENSLLKARWYSNKSGFATIADDGGLCIEVLNNEPGVQSHRWPGYEATDEELIAYTLKRLEEYPLSKRTAYLQTCITFFDPKTKKIFSETEKIGGYIAKKPSGKSSHGYPYRALFIVKKINKYYDELTHKEHETINHRLKALKRLAKKIRIYL